MGGLLAASLVAGLLTGVPSSAAGNGTATDEAYRFVAKVSIGDAAACSGALIAPQWIVTAASCFGDNAGRNGPPVVATTAIVGRTGLDHADGHAVAVVDLLFHADRDVALAKLAAPVSDVPPVAISGTAPTSGEVLRVAGYGRTATDWVSDQPHTATVSVQDVTDSTMTVVGRSPGTVTCKGDAGGPALRERDGAVELVGLHQASWQNGCLGSTETRQGATETRLDGITGWISQRLRGDAYTPLANPRRVMDTRAATGGHPTPVGPGEPLTVPLPDLPAGASAVVVNLTGADATTPTFLTAYADTYPATSNLTVLSARAAAVMATVPVGADRAIRVRNDSGTINVIVDLLGYFSPSGTSTYVPRDTPSVLLDTRTTPAAHPGPLQAGETLALPVRGVIGIPADATAVSLNITATGETSDTVISVFPSAPTDTSTLNVLRAEDRANQVVVGVGGDGAIRILNHVGQTHLIVTLLGWFVPGDAGGRYAAVPPARIVDTRDGQGPHPGPLNQGETMALPMPAGPIPSQATAAAMNITVVTPSAPTLLTAWAHGAAFPADASTVNAGPGDVVSNATTVRIGASRSVDIRNDNGSTQVVVDLQGYYLPSGGVVPAGTVRRAHADDAQSALVEDYSYPGADRILAQRGIRLIRGDGHITLAPCGGSTGIVEVRSSSASGDHDPDPGHYCFRIAGATGVLSMNIPDAYQVKGDDHSVTATVSVKGVTTTVPVEKNTWTGIGLGSGPDPATLLEIKAVS